MEEPARRFKLVFQEDSGQEGAEEQLAQAGGDASFAQCGERRPVRLPFDQGHRQQHVRGAEPGQRDRVGRPGQAAPQQVGCPAELSRRIGEPQAAVAGVQQRPRRERPQLQRTQVDPPFHLRIGRVEDLKAAVQQEPVSPVGPHPPADPVGAFQDLHRHPGRRQVERAGQARDPRPHDDHGRLIIGRHQWAPREVERAAGILLPGSEAAIHSLGSGFLLVTFCTGVLNDTVRLVHPAASNAIHCGGACRGEPTRLIQAGRDASLTLTRTLR